MTLRRSRNRSNAGCLTCKLRKVKCDETRPVCNNCNRYFRRAGTCQWGERDGLPANQKPLARLQHAAYRQNFFPVHPSNGIASHTSSEEARLFYHFTSVTCETLPLCPEPAALTLWASAVPRYASEPGYLRAALLATAALHYYHLKPDDGSMLDRASHFYGRSLRALSKDMAKPTPVNAESLVMASLLVSLLSSRFTRTLSRNKYFTPALEYFRVAKGNVALLKATAEWIKESPLKGYLASGSTSANQDAPRPPVPTSGQSIVEENVTVCSPNPKQSFLFVHQSGPSLDDHAKSNVRSYVMTDYRSSKRKDAGQHRMGRDSDRAFSVYVHQTSGNKNTIPKDLLEVIAPPEDPTFSYLLTDVPSDHPDHNAYGAYLAHLSSTLLAIRNGEPKHLVRRRISTMPARTPMEFIELVRKEDKRALVMMMHHYALLKLVDDVWWIQGTPEYNFEGLRKIVGKEWDWALERPLAVMRKVETNQLKS